MITTIPFTGFYGTLHDSEIDRAFDSLIRDSSGEPITGLIDHAWRHVNFDHAREKYTQRYVENFAKLTGAKLTFESMKSPREYNFTTDVIYCSTTASELARIVALLPDGALAAKAKERFTSRDGFMSFYSPDIESWGPLESWDHNQTGTIIECLADMHSREAEWGEWDEYALQEDLAGNGHLDNWIIKGSPAEFLRIVNIAGYLCRREER